MSDTYYQLVECQQELLALRRSIERFKAHMEMTIKSCPLDYSDREKLLDVVHYHFSFPNYPKPS